MFWKHYYSIKFIHIPAPITNIYNEQIRSNSYRQMKGVPRTVPWFRKEEEHRKEIQEPTIEQEKLVEGMFLNENSFSCKNCITNILITTISHYLLQICPKK